MWPTSLLTKLMALGRAGRLRRLKPTPPLGMSQRGDDWGPVSCHACNVATVMGNTSPARDRCTPGRCGFRYAQRCALGYSTTGAGGRVGAKRRIETPKDLGAARQDCTDRTRHLSCDTTLDCLSPSGSPSSRSGTLDRADCWAKLRERPNCYETSGSPACHRLSEGCQ